MRLEYFVEGKGIPITVRQLEAIIRISESLAKMELCTTVTIDHVKEAHRLFQVSTLNSAMSGFTSKVQPPEDLKETIFKIEEAIQKRMAIGTNMSRAKLQEEMLARFGTEQAVTFVPTTFLSTSRQFITRYKEKSFLLKMAAKSCIVRNKGE